tara:strand:- start:45 stop:218 length:174 start_codon:yes stop_codon:yes gene_type:complete
MNIESAKYFTNPLSGNTDSVLATIDGVVWLVPMESDNVEYAAIQEWVAEGNTIQEAD